MHIPVRHYIQVDETVLGWLGRWKAVGGFYDEQDTLFRLLGKERIRFHPYLPHCLRVVSENTGFPLNDLLMNNTLLPLFRYFGCGQQDRLREAMVSSGHLVNPLTIAGIPHAKCHFFYGHKFCPECVRESRAKLGYGYFKVQHQIPGIDACYKHGCLLEALEGGDLGFDRKLLLPPSDAVVEKASGLQYEFAKYCADVLTLSMAAGSGVDYQTQYLADLDRIGLLTKAGQIRHKSILSALIKFYQKFPFGTKLGVPCRFSGFEFVGPLLRDKTHFPCHPTKHLLFSFWLYAGDALQFNNKIIWRETSSKKARAINTSVETQVIYLLKKGCSMEEISKITGKSRCYIRRVAELNAIEHRSNTNAYSKCIRERVVLLALLGRHRSFIASKLNVGIGYVEQVISNTRGLVSWRKELNVLRKTEKAVQEIKLARRLHPKWRRKELKQNCNQAFFHLYNYNRKLLESLLPEKCKPIHPYLIKPK